MDGLDAGLAGLRVLVTGARGAIGSTVVEALESSGSRVIGSDLTGADAGGFMCADLTEPGEPARLARLAATELGGLDAVVNAAGLLLRRPSVAAVSEEDWDLQHDVNLKATFLLFREAAFVMQQLGSGGRLVALSSQGWWSGGYGGSVVYAASKAGVVTLCRGMAREYGPSGITVNAVVPGAIDTPMLRDDLPDDDLEAIVASTPARRLGTPGDVAGAVLYLVSGRAAFVTGTTINVSGGWLVY